MSRFTRLFSTGCIIYYSLFRVLLYRYLYSTNKPTLVGAKVIQATQFVGRGAITIESATVGVWPSPGLLCGSAYLEARNSSASISVLQGTNINNGATIIADRGSISIGQRCLIGANVFICDSDFHGIEIADRRCSNYNTSDVVIGDDVFIGEGVKILKGVEIGDGAVIGTGAVVVSDVDSYSVYAGVPAKKIRSLKDH